MLVFRTCVERFARMEMEATPTIIFILSGSAAIGKTPGRSHMVDFEPSFQSSTTTYKY